jgi:putative pyruvate formate lyase activating enzyme
MSEEQAFRPAYLDLHERGELARRAEAALARLASCDICPRQCAVNRLQDERDACNTGRLAMVSSMGPHFGEEAPLVGSRGSGTIFFAGCNLGCAFCQNADISQLCHGEEAGAEELARMMLGVQRMGCHNLNLVTPTHVTAQVLEALVHAAEGGLNIPIVYNCGGYEALETLALLDGVVDIYMPDFKYTVAAAGERLSGVPDYPEVAKAALTEMFRQVGDLTWDEHGVARRGLLVRHLVLPEDQAGTAEAMRFLAGLSIETYVNVMDQYRPCHRIHDDPLLSRGLTGREYETAVKAAQDAGLTRLDDRVRVRRIRFW